MIYYIDTTDTRLKWTKDFLSRNASCVEDYLPQAELEDNCTLIFSPAKKFTVEELDNVPNNSNIICGNLTAEQQSFLAKKHITYTNILSDETFSIKNSNLTVEGILAIILTESPSSIYSNNIAILGGGRLSKALAIILGKLGVNYSIVIMREDSPISDYYLYSKNVLNRREFIDTISRFDIIVNTIPAIIFEDSMLMNFLHDAIYIETASTPSFNTLTNRNFRLVPAPALPTRFSAKSSGELVYDFIIQNNQTQE